MVPCKVCNCGIRHSRFLRRQAHSKHRERFCNNSEIDTLDPKRLSEENKAKLSQLETTRADFVTIAKLTHWFQSDYLWRTKRNSLNWKLKTPPLQYCLFTISSWESFALFSTDNLFEISVLISLLFQNLPLFRKTGNVELSFNIRYLFIITTLPFC